VDNGTERRIDADPTDDDAPTAVVFDADAGLSGSLAHLLSLIGHQAAIAQSAEDLMSRLRRHRPALVLLGVDATDRVELLDRIRAQDAAGDKPATAVIAVTDGESEAQRLRCLVAGSCACLTRPVQADALVQAIESLEPAMSTRRLARHEPGQSDAERIRASARRLAAASAPSTFSPSAVEREAMHLERLVEALAPEIGRRDAGAVGQLASELRAATAVLGAQNLAAIASRLRDDANLGAWDRVEHLAEDVRIAQRAIIRLLLEPLG